MKAKTFILIAALVMIASLLFANIVPAAEIVTAEDLKQMVITEEHLIKTADNGLILFDASSSMKSEYRKSGRPMYDVAVEELKKAATNFPEIGHNIGLYTYNKWREIYPVQTFNRAKFMAALDALPEKPSGPTLLLQGLVKLEPVLQKVSGRTVVFIYTDGSVSAVPGIKSARAKAKELADKYNACFYLISTASSAANRQLLKDVAGINQCSRVIPIELFLARPEYNTGALFVVKSTSKVVTLSDRKVVGVKVDNIHFDFDNNTIQEVFYKQLDEVAAFMQKNPSTYIVIEGYADNTGDPEYNMYLSRQRAESVGAYLEQNHNVDPSRIVTSWYGATNPTASNDSPQGRALNRRAEIAIGGL
jgi:OOP family OmpA-OmpF porin